MERMADIRKSGAFQFKKWTLIVFCTIGIVMLILSALVAIILLDSYLYSMYPDRSKDWRHSIRDISLFSVWVATVLAVFFNWIGLMGAYMEHYCMTFTYGILMTMESLFSVLLSTQNYYYLADTALSFIVCVITFSYSCDLRKIKIEMIRQDIPQMVFINAGLTHPTVIDMITFETEQTFAVKKSYQPVPPPPPLTELIQV